MAENGISSMDDLKSSMNVKDQHAKTTAEFSNLAASRQTPNKPAATGASGIAYVSVVAFILAIRYLDILRYGFKLTWMVLGITVAAEVAGKSLFNSGFATQLRPRKYYMVPRDTLDVTIGDVHELVNFFVIESQRILFAENVGASTATCLGAFLSYYLANVVPYWGLALIATTVVFFVPLIYATNQELIDHHVAQANEIVAAQSAQFRVLAHKHTETATQLTKQYMGEYTAKAQAMIRGNKVEPSKAELRDVDFPAAPKEEFSTHNEDVKAAEREPLIAA